MKNISSAVFAASLVLLASAAQAASTATLLNQSAKSIISEQWYRGAIASRTVLDRATASTRETMTALNNLCIQQTKLNQFKDAMAACDKSVALGPDQWANYMNRGNLLALTGNVRAAMADYARANELNPAHPAARSAMRSAGVPKPVTPSFIALSAGDLPGAQRAEVGQ